MARVLLILKDVRPAAEARSPLCAHRSRSDGGGGTRPGGANGKGLCRVRREAHRLLSPQQTLRPRECSCSPSLQRKVVSVSQRASLCLCARHSRMAVGSAGCPDPDLSFPGKAMGARHGRRSPGVPASGHLPGAVAGAASPERGWPHGPGWPDWPEPLQPSQEEGLNAYCVFLRFPEHRKYKDSKCLGQ